MQCVRLVVGPGWEGESPFLEPQRKRLGEKATVMSRLLWHVPQLPVAGLLHGFQLGNP